MGALGGDVVAVVCIMGGAAVGAGATLAVLEGDRERVDIACSIETASHGSHAWVDMRGEGAVVVVRPHVTMGTGRECVSVRAVRRMERAAREMDGLDEAIEGGLAAEAAHGGGWSGGGE